jgi:hypothetical protein
MIRIIDNVVSEEDIQTIMNLERVIEHRKMIGNSTGYKRIYFETVLPESIIQKINKGFDLHLDPNRAIPFKWLQGDNPKHSDKDPNNQTAKTHLIYLTDNEGKFILERQEYEIKKGRGFIFPPGALHETRGTHGSPKLLIAINEKGECMGIPFKKV